MRKARRKIAVLSKNSLSLFGYACILNKKGYYSLSLCNHGSEVIELLEVGKRFDYLVYDAFDLTIDGELLKEITEYRAIGSVIAMSDVNSLQRQGLSMWARANDIPLRGVLQSPLRAPELFELIECYDATQ